jgi:ABC-type multidrug transport system permease subunit
VQTANVFLCYGSGDGGSNSSCVVFGVKLYVVAVVLSAVVLTGFLMSCFCIVNQVMVIIIMLIIIIIIIIIIVIKYLYYCIMMDGSAMMLSIKIHANS